MRRIIGGPLSEVAVEHFNNPSARALVRVYTARGLKL